MVSSWYQIIGKRGEGCKIFFTDKRMDKFRPQIYEVFDMMDEIDGSYTPQIQDHITGKYQKTIKLIENVKRKTDDCRHKTMATRYSLALIEQEILNKPTGDDMKNYSQMIANKMCDQAELKNDVLIYETEAFLFKVRTNLDILIQLLKYIPDYEYLRKTNGNKDREKLIFSDDKSENNTTNKMRVNGHDDMADFFDAQLEGWIKKLNIKRNEIAHRSGLKGFTNFVFDSGSGKVIHPQMSDEIKVDEYCVDIFDKLLAIYKKVFQDFVLPKFKSDK